MEPQCLRRVIDDVGRDAGYEELTTNQVDAITTFLHGKDVFVSLPTGSGKSVCFALLPIVVDALKAVVGVPCKRKSILVVISPLISLMEDQVARFSARGISSVVALPCSVLHYVRTSQRRTSGIIVM